LFFEGELKIELLYFCPKRLCFFVLDIPIPKKSEGSSFLGSSWTVSLTLSPPPDQFPQSGIGELRSNDNGEVSERDAPVVAGALVFEFEPKVNMPWGLLRGELLVKEKPESEKPIVDAALVLLGSKEKSLNDVLAEVVESVGLDDPNPKPVKPVKPLRPELGFNVGELNLN
jgi:hypothetical protein